MCELKIETKPRYEFIDTAKGICILLVVFLHIVGKPFPDGVNFTLKCFRMPLYFILSGMFFSTYTGFMHFAVKKFNKLLVPYFAFALIAYILLNLKSFLLGYEPRWNDIIPISAWNVPLWFLGCLFECGVIFYLIVLFSASFRQRQIEIIVVIPILLGLLGFYLSGYNIKMPFFLGQSMLGLPFYAFGYILRKYTSFLSMNMSSISSIIISALLMLFTFLVAKHSAVDIATCNVENKRFVTYLLCGVSGTMSILIISKVLGGVTCPYLVYLGRYSVCILVTHFLFNELFLVSVCNILYEWFPCVSMIVWKVCSFFIILLLYRLIIPCMIMFMPHICAQKDIVIYKSE